jgi:endonuclease G
MRISADLVQGSERRLNFDPKKKDAELGEDDRERWLTTEQKERRLSQLFTETGSPERARTAFERILNGNDLVSINYLAKGMWAARSIGRIQLRRSWGDVVGYGTGFLIGPGLLMTNEHVFAHEGDARHSIVDFDYELDLNGREREAVHFGFDPQRFFYANKELDFAVVAVAAQSLEGGRPLSDFGWLPLSAEPGKSDPGEYLTIIQHPGGELKQVCVRENKLLKYMDDTLWYMTDTVGGSSGSPVFNRFWQVVGLHHSGVPKQDASGNWLTKDGKIWDQSMDESTVDWIANEGIRISSIVNHLLAKVGNEPLVQSALNGSGSAPLSTERVSPNGHKRLSGGDFWAETDGDSVSLVIPIRIPLDAVRKGITPSASAPTAAAAPQPVPGATLRIPIPTGDGDRLIEKVVINQNTLNSRPGYKPNFLGTGKLSVPLPGIPAALKSKVAALKKKDSGSELKYFNYSVVMNKQRKLAFFSAVNIDGKLRRDVGKREGDKWLRDPRIADEAQIGDEFYKRQALDEAREKNPFDRGHLVRRLDATWAASEAEAKEHGDDTFHFTNCAPQFFSFNQGRKLWLGIEEFILDQLEADKRKACVFNGPVFDGPLAEEGELPDPGDPPKADPSFKGLAIPKFFWKLVVTVVGGRLAAAAFVLSQQDQILEIDRIEEKLSEKQARVFQVSIADLARFTKLNFGKLNKSDTKEAARKAKPRKLERLDDIRI